MKECPFCGTKIKDESRPCPGCGYGYGMNGNEIIESPKPTANEAMAKQHSNQNNNAEDKDVKTVWKVVLIFLCIFLTPITGIAAGFSFNSMTYPKYKRFGKTLIIISVIMLFVNMAFSILSGIYGYL